MDGSWIPLKAISRCGSHPPLYPSSSNWVTGNLVFWEKQSINAGKDFRGFYSWGSCPRESMDELCEGWGGICEPLNMQT